MHQNQAAVDTNDDDGCSNETSAFLEYTDSDSSMEPLTRPKRKQRPICTSESDGNVEMEQAEEVPESPSHANDNVKMEETKEQTNEKDAGAVKHTRKRTRNPDNWKRNLKRRKRCTGQAYLTKHGKQKRARQIRAGCNVTCRYGCKGKITEDQRRSIFEEYWALGDHTRQREFVARNVQKTEKGRQVKHGCSSRRKFSYRWSFDVSSKRIQVCKTYFLATLDISDKVVANASGSLTEAGFISPDQRGKHHNRSNKLPDAVRQSVHDHIASFPRVESHYLRRDTNREYLEEGLSLSTMYRMYEESCNQRDQQPAKKWLYEHIFNKETTPPLSFFRPKKDLCSFCEKVKNSTDTERSELTEKIEEHHRNKELSRAEKEADKKHAQQDPRFVCACFDLQKVLPVPAGDVSLFYYKRKLAVYNLSVYNIGAAEGFCFMWHEGIAARGANEIATCVYKYILEHSLPKGVQEIVFYSDNCAGQNRNHIIATMYAKVVASTEIKVITHKFLEHGHTQNEGDSMHSTIEAEIGRTPVYSPQQYYIMARLAKKRGKPYVVTELAGEDFLDFKGLADGDNTAVKNWTIDENGKRVMWTKLRVLQLRKDKPGHAYYKNDYNEEFKVIKLNPEAVQSQRPRRKTKAQSSIDDLTTVKVAQLCYGPRAITRAKHDDLLSLCAGRTIPTQYHSFFKHDLISE